VDAIKEIVAVVQTSVVAPQILAETDKKNGVKKNARKDARNAERKNAMIIVAVNLHGKHLRHLQGHLALHLKIVDAMINLVRPCLYNLLLIRQNF